MFLKNVINKKFKHNPNNKQTLIWPTFGNLMKIIVLHIRRENGNVGELQQLHE